MASKVLPTVYSGFEDLRRGCFHFLGSLQVIHRLHASLHYSLVRRTATGHQMKLKWLEKKKAATKTHVLQWDLVTSSRKMGNNAIKKKFKK